MRDNVEVNIRFMCTLYPTHVILFQVAISAGHEMIFSVDEQYKDICDDQVMYMDYKNLPKVIKPGKMIYVDDGVLSFDVLSVDGDEIRVKARNNGKLCAHKGVNLPGTNVDLPALSEKDKADLRFGVKNGVDMVFASFIRSGQDIRDIRQVLGEDGKHIKIIAKIENHQGVENFDDILQETDGVMVARGVSDKLLMIVCLLTCKTKQDMGIEIPLERVFIAQKMMITKCNLAGKPVIW